MFCVPGSEPRLFRPRRLSHSDTVVTWTEGLANVLAAGRLNSVSGLVSNIWYRIPFDQSELSVSKIRPTDSPNVRPGYDP